MYALFFFPPEYAFLETKLARRVWIFGVLRFGVWLLGSKMAVTAVTGKWPGVACKPALQSTSSFTETPARLACKSRNSGSAGKVQARAAAVSTKEEQWEALDSDVDYLTRSARLVQWYPGHIAKAERSLKEQLKLMDVVIEVRDARIPMATAHPEIDEWMGHKKKILVLNREDMVSAADKQAWGEYFAKQGISVLFSNGQRGTGTMKLARLAKSAADELNERRRVKGLLPRNVRAAVVGYPNVGKSSLINRLLKRKMCGTAPRPGVTKHLQWARVVDGLDLLDAPGVLPMRIQDQAGATRLAICNDIGENSYAVAGVAAVLVEMIKRIPTAGPKVLEKRYKMENIAEMSGEFLLEELSQALFQGDVNQAAHRVLRDFRKGEFGWIALERPPVRREEREEEYDDEDEFEIR